MVNKLETKEILNAYLAGFSDAEGCFRIRLRENTWTPYISFGQTRPEGILVAWKEYDGSLITRRQVNKRRTIEAGTIVYNKRELDLTIAKLEDAIRFMNAVHPMLLGKRSQVSAILEALEKDPDRKDMKIAEELYRLLSKEKNKNIKVDQRTKDKKCLRCDDNAIARGLCSLHYQRLKIAAIKAGTWDPHLIKKFCYGRAPTDRDKAYLAGFFDGDGNLDLFETISGFFPAVVFDQTAPEPVLFINEIYADKVIFRNKAGTRRNRVEIKLTAQEVALQFIQDIAPYSQEKLFEINLMLNSWHPKLTYKEAFEYKAKIAAFREWEIPENYLDSIKPPKQIVVCSVCGGPNMANNLCAKHHGRWKKYGDPKIKSHRINGKWTLCKEEPDGTLTKKDFS